MNVTPIISKRKRIENLVGKAIAETAVADNRIAKSGLLIMDAVKCFTEVWPAKYFDIADDRKIAGLVLAYLMESAEIGVEDMSEHGCLLLKTAAEIDLHEFSENMPKTFAKLKHRHLLESRNGEW
jgi:hypothetical protein